MRYEQLVSKTNNFTYRDFHELYSQVQYSLDIYISLSRDVDDGVALYGELSARLYSVASNLLCQLHEKDDEYGTNAYCGAPVSYDDCAYKFIDYIYDYWRVEIDAVLYEGEVNSVSLIGFDARRMEQHLRYLDEVEKDENLPF